MHARTAGYVWAGIWLLFVVYTAAVIIWRPVSLGVYIVNLEPWSWDAQILVDLGLMAVIALSFILPDAKKNGFELRGQCLLAVGTLLLGSLVPLVYMSWRGLRRIETGTG